MKKLSTKESKMVKGGGYKCPACAYVSPTAYGRTQHAWAWHNIRI